MSTKNLSISCLLGNISFNYAVSLNCTGTNNQLMLKHCSKSDKVAKITYQQQNYQPALLLSSIWK